MTTNRLRIRAKSLELDLSGDADYVLRAYDAVHTVLMERFVESVEGVLEEAATPATPPSSTLAAEGSRTIPMHKPYEPTLEDPQHLNVVVCNEVYNKIYLVEAACVQRSPFARAIDFSNVRRVYINRTQRVEFAPFVETGKVLWRELTTAGKAVVKGV